MRLNQSRPKAAIPADISRAAAEWLVELQSAEQPETLRQQWQAWRDAHPDHERAWQHIELLGEKLGGLSSPLAHATLAPRAPSSAGVPSKPWPCCCLQAVVPWRWKIDCPGGVSMPITAPPWANHAI
ncbi:FecR/PupR family sigma factor regulator [Methylobacillus glycogenes]|uniref:FecR/PupR family sigma factor regulator n=1 Tax=Methylobacillus glycogenes TaxID=406 RepID=UPI001F2FC8E1|nr:DUF4880 domain-containing protein [Methylobacillus glycogenes]